MKDSIMSFAAPVKRAYETGIDGMQWIEANYDIPIGDFQATEMKRMQSGSKVIKMLEYQVRKQSEYAIKFERGMAWGIIGND
ncbi:hypothetical protein [Neisseria iguanae]|nr:hypothetical protein [Neisseria iguanae]